MECAQEFLLHQHALQIHRVMESTVSVIKDTTLLSLENAKDVQLIHIGMEKSVQKELMLVKVDMNGVIHLTNVYPLFPFVILINIGTE